MVKGKTLTAGERKVLGIFERAIKTVKAGGKCPPCSHKGGKGKGGGFFELVNEVGTTLATGTKLAPLKSKALALGKEGRVHRVFKNGRNVGGTDHAGKWHAYR